MPKKNSPSHNGDSTERNGTNVPKEVRLLDHLQRMEAAVGDLAARHRLRPDEREELLSVMRLKLVEGRLLEKVRGDGRIGPFYYKCAERTLFDRWLSRYGKWRPTRKAVEAGSHAVEIQRLIYRDRHTLREAIEILRHKYGWDVTSAEAHELASRIPQRPPRVFVAEKHIRNRPSAGLCAERLAAGSQRRRRRRQIEALLEDALKILTEEERTLLRYRFQDGMTIAQIARRHHLNQRRLYSVLGRVLRRLKRFLQRRGLSSVELEELVGQASGDISLDL